MLSGNSQSEVAGSCSAKRRAIFRITKASSRSFFASPDARRRNTSVIGSTFEFKGELSPSMDRVKDGTELENTVLDGRIRLAV